MCWPHKVVEVTRLERIRVPRAILWLCPAAPCLIPVDLDLENVTEKCRNSAIVHELDALSYDDIMREAFP